MKREKRDDIGLLREVVKNLDVMIYMLEEIQERTEDLRLKQSIGKQITGYIEQNYRIKEKMTEYPEVSYSRTVLEEWKEKLEYRIPLLFNLSNEKILETLVVLKTKRQLRLKSALLRFNYAGKAVTKLVIDLLHFQEQSILELKKYV